MTLEIRKKEIVKTFNGLQSWEEKYKKIIDLGRALPGFPEECRTEDNRISGCVSKVWLFAKFEDGRVKYFVDSDALIVKGLVAVLHKTYSGLTPAEILADNGSIIRDIGLEENLSPNRINGMQATFKQIKIYALAFSKMI